jgi:hypothetical protein
VCPQERLVIISYITGLSFALERIGPLASITFIVFYLLVLYLLALPNTPENPFASIYSESLIKSLVNTFCSLLGSTLIYQKYYDTPPILVGHQGVSGGGAGGPPESPGATREASHILYIEYFSFSQPKKFTGHLLHI